MTSVKRYPIWTVSEYYSEHPFCMSCRTRRYPEVPGVLKNIRGYLLTEAMILSYRMGQAFVAAVLCVCASSRTRRFLELLRGNLGGKFTLEDSIANPSILTYALLHSILRHCATCHGRETCASLRRPLACCICLLMEFFFFLLNPDCTESRYWYESKTKSQFPCALMDPPPWRRYLDQACDQLKPKNLVRRLSPPTVPPRGDRTRLHQVLVRPGRLVSMEQNLVQTQK